MSTTLFNHFLILTGRRPRLRHVLYLGAIMERQAEAFYRRCCAESSHAGVRAIGQRLAQEEARHLAFVEAILARWRPVRVRARNLKALDADGRLRAMFSAEPSSMTPRGVIEYAMEQEQNMLDFYEQFEEIFSSSWKVLKLEAMVREEEQHYLTLKELLPKLAAR